MPNTTLESRILAHAAVRPLAFTPAELAWLKLKSSGDVPPVLGSLNEQEEFEHKIFVIVRELYERELATSKKDANDFLTLVQRSEREGLLIGKMAASALIEEVNRVSPKDVARFGMTFLSQSMLIIGLVLIAVVVISFIAMAVWH